MFINALKRLFQSNNETEVEESTDTPSANPQFEQWQNFQPWGGIENTTPFMTPDANTERNESSGGDTSVQEEAQNPRRTKMSNKRTQRRALFGRGNSAASRPNVRAPIMNQQPGVNRQPGGPFIPQPYQQPRMIQSPQFGHPQTMRPKQGIPYPPLYGQPWNRGYPGGVAHPGIRRQAQMFDEWGVPVQRRNAIPQGTFGFPSHQRMGYPPQQRQPFGGTMYPGVPRRRFQEPWL